MRRSALSLVAVLLMVAAAAAVAWFLFGGVGQPTTTTSSSGLLLSVLDVGQADSIFVKSPAGRTMLVDAGNELSDAEKVILPHLKKQGISSLDYLVLTHPDQDHVGGMPGVLDGLSVGAFVDSVQPGITNSAYRQTLQKVQSKAVKPIKARRGVSEIDMGEGTEVEVLGPEDPLLTKGDSDTNNNSVVLRISYGSVSAFLAGDIEREAEERLLSHPADIHSQILKVAHHGSQGSSTNEFLDAVRPDVALISVGAGNSYGHPQSAALQRLEGHQAKVYRTDLQGTIEAAVDGRGYSVAPEKQ